MDFWTFIIIVVTIVILGNVRKKTDIDLQADKTREAAKKEIDDLKQRVNDLEKLSKKGIEKRLQAIETIVVDSDYQLSMKFKELLEDDNKEDRHIFTP